MPRVSAVIGARGVVCTLGAGALPRRILVSVDVLDAHGLTIATGAGERIVEVPGPLSSERR